jgi:hypothetical protein
MKRTPHRNNRPPPSWSAIRARLTTYDHTALLDVVQDLFAHSPEAQTFLASHVLGQNDHVATLDTYRQDIIDVFYPKGGPSWEYGLDLPGAQRLIQTYRQATLDIAGTLELMLTLVETGTRFTNDYGDIDEVFYLTLSATLADLSDLVQMPAGRSFYPTIRERLLALHDAAADSGWGYGDAVADLVHDLRVAMDDLP